MTSPLHLSRAALLLLAATLFLACGSDDNAVVPVPAHDGDTGVGASDDAGATDDRSDTAAGSDTGTASDDAGTSTDDAGSTPDTTPADSGGSPDATPDAGIGADTTPEPDTAPEPDAAPEPDTTPEPDTAPEPDAAPDPTTATLHGRITRSASPSAGGVGHLYVAVFADNPMIAGDGAEVVGRTRTDDVDMRDGGAFFDYEVADITPRTEPYYVTGFLDDNGTVDESAPSSAGPDRGDLVSLDGIAIPTVTMSAPVRVEFDIDLNIAMPF